MKRIIIPPQTEGKLTGYWLKYCKTDEEREKLKASVLASGYILSILKQIITEESQAVSRQETSIEDFDNPSWSYKQAYRNGIRKGLKITEDLLSHIRNS
jgi:hypothetical protein